MLNRRERQRVVARQRAELRRDWAKEEELPFLRYGGRGVHTRSCRLVQGRNDALLAEDDPYSPNWPTFLTLEQAQANHSHVPCKLCNPPFRRKSAQEPIPNWRDHGLVEWFS